MLVAGIKTPVPLIELENHLREEIERQIKSGLNDQQAFEISARQVGQPKTLNRKFNKSERNIMKRMAIMALGIFGVLFGSGLILPALAKHKNFGIWNFEIVCLVVLGAVITLGGICVAIIGFKKRKA